MKEGSKTRYAHIEDDEKIPLDKGIKDMWRQVAKLTHQLDAVRSLGNDEKSDYGYITNFENLFRRHE